MPLSKPSKRKLLHTRKVTCEGYLRDDGLMDIEGHLVDTKSYDFPNNDRGGHIPAGEPLHGISARIARGFSGFGEMVNGTWTTKA